MGIVLGALSGVGFAALSDLPALRRLEEYHPATSTRILDREGRLLDEIFVERREPVAAAEIPEALKQALIATEDARFYRHHGIDARGLVRAVLRSLVSGERIKATSTLTQQLAKNLFLTPERSLVRKLKEMALAFQIERTYTKAQILTLYLNQIYLGSGSFGVEAAAKRYFGKGVRELDLGQCALLAGLPKSPAGYDPFRHPDKARARRAVVLSRMRDEGFLTEAEVERWREAPLALVPEESRASGRGRAPYFVAAIRPALEARFGEDALYRGGLQVWTTLDLDLQSAAEESLLGGLAAVRARQIDHTRRAGGDPGTAEEPEGALIALHPATGDVLAWVGGRSWAKSQFDRASMARRQPGSAFKPIVFAAAIEAGYTQASLLWDAPISYPDRRTGKEWTPKNYYPGYLGRITVRTALEQSSNSASIYLLERIGVGTVVDEARRLGITSPLAPNLTLALGSSDLTLLELTRAYAAIANGGVRTEERTILRVLDRNGRTLFESPPSPGRPAMSPENAYVVADLLRGVTTHGLSRRVGDLPFWVGGKTGTTNRSTDSLFVGFTSSLAAGVWVGLDSHKPMAWGESGSRAAQPIFHEFVAKAAAKTAPLAALAAPRAVNTVEVDPESGQRATDACAERIPVAFVAGTEPARDCAEETALPDLRHSLERSGPVLFE